MTTPTPQTKPAAAVSKAVEQPLELALLKDAKTQVRYAPFQSDSATGEHTKAEVGPRLTKQVEDALKEINWQHGFYKETIVGLEAACQANDYKQRLLLHVPERPPLVPASESTSASGVTVRRNLEHNGVEISFPSKPDQGVINELKGAGFRWSMRSKVWYKKYGGYAWAQAHRIAGIELPAEPPTAGPSADPFDMAVEDRMAESAGVGGFEQPD